MSVDTNVRGVAAPRTVDIAESISEEKKYENSIV
jgi:hypothetical protein